MAKTYYVDGNIAVMTPYFICKDAGSGFSIPENADTLKTNDVIDGAPILIIDENRPQSIFNKYYATGEFSTIYIEASYLCLTYEECYQNYNNDISQVNNILYEINKLSDTSKSILYKTLYINIVTILDSFLCSIILRRIIDDEIMFREYYKKHIPSHIHKSLEHYLIDDQKAKWEQEYIKEVLKGSYCNTNTIKEIFKLLKWPVPALDQLTTHFHTRHILVHRNGKKRDGSCIIIDDTAIKKIIDDFNLFVRNIMNKIA